jgi:anthranilate synthase component 1
MYKINHNPCNYRGIGRRWYGDANGKETAPMKQHLKFNLGLNEYLTAVRDQPKPLIIPLCAELALPTISPLDVYTGTRTGCGFLFESMEGSEKIARYSYIGIDPEFVVTIDKTVDIRGNERFAAIAKEPEGETPVDKIKSILSRFCYVNVKAPRFFGGMVGYFAYDCVYPLFDNVREGYNGCPPSVRNCARGDHEARFMLTKDCIVFDHAERKLFIFSSPFLTYESDLKEEYEKSFEKIRTLGDRIAYLASGKSAGKSLKQVQSKKPEYTLSVSQEAFELSVERVK